MVALRSVAQQSFPVAWKGWELLTPAEREVAELVCTGLTNKQDRRHFVVLAAYRRLASAGHLSKARRYKPRRSRRPCDSFE
jgi:hypothetical protein